MRTPINSTLNEDVSNPTFSDIADAIVAAIDDGYDSRQLIIDEVLKRYGALGVPEEIVDATAQRILDCFERTGR